MLSGQSILDLNAILAADGSFEFPKVLPGTYRAQVLPAIDRQNPTIVNVVGDIDGLEIAIPRQIEVSGRTIVDFYGPMLPRFGIQATSLSGISVNALAGNGTFRMILPEGTYRFMTSGFPAGYSVRSMKSGAVDLLTESLVAVGDTPIPEIVVTIGVSTPTPWKKVSGRVVAAPGTLFARRNPRRPGWGIRQFSSECKSGWLVRVPQGSAESVQIANQFSPPFRQRL